jgi:hypothetical protein
MKTKTRSLLIISLFFILPFITIAQNPPHPNGGGGPGSGNTPVGGGAPVGSGLIILMALGAGYSSVKVYNYRKGLDKK